MTPGKGKIAMVEGATDELCNPKHFCKLEKAVNYSWKK
jgi:hypothetical protein